MRSGQAGAVLPSPGRRQTGTAGSPPLYQNNGAAASCHTFLPDRAARSGPPRRLELS